MKLKINKKKVFEFLILFISVFFLYLTSYNNHEINRINEIKNSSNIDLINKKKVSSKELFLDCWSTTKHNYYMNDLNKQNWSRWKKRYQNEIKTDEDAYVAINSMLASLDDSYSKFMSQDEFLIQNNAINSKLYGIGINIASNAGKIYIVNVLENAPAYNASIRQGDIILKINKKDLSGQSIYDAARLIRGNIDEPLELEILRGNKRFTKTVKREEIKIKTVEYKKINDDIGYIRILSFVGTDTSKEFIVALNKLKEAKGLILDLRGNSGGLFQNAIIIANLFINKGTIVNVIARQGKKNTYTAQNYGCIYNNPLAILIDEDSASASEILSSALHDNNRAALIGTRTYGKGLVQKVYSMPNKSGMNLTIARYLTPNGLDINQKGVEPDYTVTFSHNDFINNIDPQLAYAQKYLENIIKE